MKWLNMTVAHFFIYYNGNVRNKQNIFVMNWATQLLSQFKEGEGGDKEEKEKEENWEDEEKTEEEGEKEKLRKKWGWRGRNLILLLMELYSPGVLTNIVDEIKYSLHQLSKVFNWLNVQET